MVGQLSLALQHPIGSIRIDEPIQAIFWIMKDDFSPTFDQNQRSADGFDDGLYLDDQAFQC